MYKYSIFTCKILEKVYIKAVLLAFTLAYFCGLLIYEFAIWKVNNTNDLVFSKYLIFNNKCKMPDINPWHVDALEAFEHLDFDRNSALQLVDMDRRDDRVFLVLKRASIPVKRCVACAVLRDANSSVPDNNITYTNCRKFRNEIEMTSSIIDVKCFDEKTRVVYQDVFANYIWRSKRNRRSFGNTKPYNVLIIGIDSISKLNFIRVLKKTYKFLLASNWVDYVAYNKVEANTLPNLMAILSGRVAFYRTYQNSYHNSFFDKERFIWDDYGRLGYTTAFAEDHKSWSTFNNGMNGFKHSPTDFYFRPYTIAIEEFKLKIIRHIIEQTIFSAGGKIVGDRMFQLVTELPKACKEQPYFGLFWMNTFSHDDINTPQLMDKHIVSFLEDLQTNNVFNDTILIFLSDHGIRFGNLRKSIAGSYEDRMPFLFIRIPDHFKIVHPKEYENFVKNSKKLTSTFDIHMTLQHILILSKLNYTVKPAEHCPKCLSIFEEIPMVRSCADAGIPKQYCACTRLIDIDTNSFISRKIAEYIIQSIQRIIDSNPTEARKCQKLVLSKVLHARMNEKSPDEPSTQFNIILETNPNTIIEAMLDVFFENNHMVAQRIIGGPDRLDNYWFTGICCKNLTLAKFCYCKRW